MNEVFKDFIRDRQARVETTLEHWLPSSKTLPKRLHKAMRYASLNGGKYIRPLLVYATGHALGVKSEQLDGPAASVEFIHAYSLVHDDLPAMDDDDLRRGKPSCHKAFDEASALLAGDALQSLPFYILSHDKKMQADAIRRLRMVESLALACGSRGMAGGQAIDLASVGKELNLAELENMHIHKTGALIRASVKLGALSQNNCDEDLINTLDHFAKCIGLAFQIKDDILDVEGDTETLGKPQGSDMAQNKPTYPALLGVRESEKMATELLTDALGTIAGMDENADPLRWTAGLMVNRSY